MVDTLGGLMALTAAGAFGGFVSSWMSFNAMGEKFHVKKHLNAIISGVLTGVGAGVAAATIPQLAAMDYAAFYILVIFTFLGGAGVNSLRTSGTQMKTSSSNHT